MRWLDLYASLQYFYRIDGCKRPRFFDSVDSGISVCVVRLIVKSMRVLSDLVNSNVYFVKLQNVDTIYLSHDSRELCLHDFDHLEAR